MVIVSKNEEDKNMTVLQGDERLDIIRSKNLSIIQSPSVFSYSIDALLLAEFARIPQSYKSNIVDLCAGTGAVTMLLAHKTRGNITGVELQERLANMANRSIKLNKLETQVTVMQEDVRELSEFFTHDSVDAITCNPPYFKIGDSAVNPNEHLAIARHEVYLDLSSLISEVSRMLKMNGTFFIVYRPDRFLELLDELRTHHLTPKRLQMVYPKIGSEATMILVEAIKYGSDAGFKVDFPLHIMDNNGNYTSKMKEIIYGES